MENHSPSNTVLRFDLSSLGSMVSISGPGLKEGTPIVVLGNERIYPGASVRTSDGQPSQEKSPDDESSKGQPEESAAEHSTDNDKTDG